MVFARLSSRRVPLFIGIFLSCQFTLPAALIPRLLIFRRCNNLASPGFSIFFSSPQRRRERKGVFFRIERQVSAALAINATLIYHALTYDVDGSRMSRDKTNRRNWRWQAVSCRRGPPLVFAARYPALGANKTCLINKCINIAPGPRCCFFLSSSFFSSPLSFFLSVERTVLFFESYPHSRWINAKFLRIFLSTRLRHNFFLNNNERTRNECFHFAVRNGVLISK